MFRVVYPNRWLVWAIVVELVASVIVLWQIQIYSIEQDEVVLEYISIATGTRSHLSNINSAGWKTYRNEKYGFEFQYRNDFSIAELYPTPETLTLLNYTLAEVAHGGVVEKIGGFSIVFTVRSTGSISQLATEHQKLREKIYLKVSRKNLDVNGHNAIEIMAQDESNKYALYPFTSLTAYVEISPSVFITISGYAEGSADPKEIQNVIEAILSTFKFIPSTGEPQADTSGWKTYRNEKYGFEIQYPDNWNFYTESDSALLSFGPSSTNAIRIDPQCIYLSAYGLEESGVVTSENITARFGSNLFEEEKVYTDGYLFNHSYSIAFPNDYFQKYATSENGYLSFCKSAGVLTIFVKDDGLILAKSLPIILSTFKFIN